MPVDRNPSITFAATPARQRQLAESRFLTDSDSLAQQRGLSEMDALAEASRLDPSSYHRYRNYSTGYLTEPSTSLSGEASKRLSELVEAKVAASGGKLTYGDAFEQVVAESPELFAAYRAEWATV